MPHPTRPRRGEDGVLTFDLFSALIDSRTGGTAALGRIAGAHRDGVDAAALYDAWDAANKASQRDTGEWLPFREHSRRALRTAYEAAGLDPAAADDDAAALLASVGDWPLWPDVAVQLPALAARHRVGVLSNVDDDVLAATAVGRLGGVLDPDLLLTSERLRACKPHPEIYRRAAAAAGPGLVHVASSARDVRGALEAGLAVVRLRRPGHGLDPAGPRPPVEVDDVATAGTAAEGLAAPV